MGTARKKRPAPVEAASAASELPPPEEIAVLKAKHGEIFHVDFGVGGFIHRKPSQAETDACLFGTVRERQAESAGNLIFATRLWPSVEKLEEHLEEAPGVLIGCCEKIMETVGADDETLLSIVAPTELRHMAPADRTEIEARIGQKLDVLENAHPRGCLRFVRLPVIGVSIFRRPTRTSFATFTDLRGTDELMQACRDLCAEIAITDGKALPSLFSTHPAVSFHLAFAMAGLAGAYLEVKSGKL